MNSSIVRKPCLPQDLSALEQEQRAFELSLCRTNYNYMFSYLEPLPMSADLPPGEKFTPDYEMKVLQAFIPLAENFKNVIVALLEKEIQQDLPRQALPAIEAVEAAFAKLKNDTEHGFNPFKDLADLKALLEVMSALPRTLQQSLNQAARLPVDLMKISRGVVAVFEEFQKEGPTAFR
jgi:arachidonate 15-lipoxygenase